MCLVPRCAALKLVSFRFYWMDLKISFAIQCRKLWRTCSYPLANCGMKIGGMTAPTQRLTGCPSYYCFAVAVEVVETTVYLQCEGRIMCVVIKQMNCSTILFPQFQQSFYLLISSITNWSYISCACINNTEVNLAAKVAQESSQWLHDTWNSQLPLTFHKLNLISIQHKIKHQKMG